MKKINLSVSLNFYTDKNLIKWNKVNYSEQFISIEEFINLITKGYCFCHVFKHNGNILTQKEKTKANFISADCIFVDVDDCQIEMNDYINKLSILPTIAYTTFNNKKNNLYRFRLIYVLNQSINNIDIYNNVYNYITNKLVEDTNIQMKDNCCSSVNQQIASNVNAELYVNENSILEIGHSKSIILKKEENIIKLERPICNKENNTLNNDLNSNNILNNNLKSNNELNNDLKYNSNSNLNSISDLNSIENKNINKIGINNFTQKEGKIIDNNYPDIISFNELFFNVFMLFDYYTFINKYIEEYPYFYCTKLPEVDDDTPYILLPENYIEIKRYWINEKEKNEEGELIKRTTHVKRIKDGEGRRKKLFLNGILRRMMYPDINIEYMLVMLSYELYFYIDNRKDKITKFELLQIAQNVMLADISKYIQLSHQEHPKFIVNNKYCEKHSVNRKQARNIAKKMINYNAIGNYYDCQLSDKENLRIMKENGLTVSQKTLTRFKQENRLTRNYNKKEIGHSKSIILKKEENIIKLERPIETKENDTLNNDFNLNNNLKSNNEIDKSNNIINNDLNSISDLNSIENKNINKIGINNFTKEEDNNIELERPIEEMTKAKENINTLYNRFSILNNISEINTKYNMFMTYLFKQCFSKEITDKEYKEYCDMVTAKKLELLSNCHSMSVA